MNNFVIGEEFSIKYNIRGADTIPEVGKSTMNYTHLRKR